MSTSDEQRTSAPPPPPGPSAEETTQMSSASSADARTGDADREDGGRGASGRERVASGRNSGSSPRGASSMPGPRKVRLTVARVDPWSVMKLGFLLSVAFGIMIVVASAIIWGVLDTMAVFDKMNTFLLELGNEGLLGIMEFVKFDRVMSMATIIAVVDVVLLTALATLGAFLYNITAALVGGIHVTMTDD